MDEKRRKETIKWARDIILSVVLLPTILAYFHVSAIVIIVVAVALLMILKLWENCPMNTWGPWVLIIGGPIIGALWLYIVSPDVFRVAPQMILEPGASVQAQPSTDLIRRVLQLDYMFKDFDAPTMLWIRRMAESDAPPMDMPPEIYKKLDEKGLVARNTAGPLGLSDLWKPAVKAWVKAHPY